MPWREITIERASERSCGLEGIGNQIERRPIASIRVFDGRMMKLCRWSSQSWLRPGAAGCYSRSFPSIRGQTGFFSTSSQAPSELAIIANVDGDVVTF